MQVHKEKRRPNRINPECKHTRNYTRDEKGKIHPVELPE